MDGQALWQKRLIPGGQEGGLTLEGTALTCGAVLLLREASGGRVLMVQKAPRSGYEFSNLWVLPGGTLRSIDQEVEEGMVEAGRRTLCERLALETGLSLEGSTLQPVRSVDPPPVTCYTAKGKTRFTLVLLFFHEPLPSPPRGLSPRCSSIQGLRWCDPATCWDEIAPANQLLLANLLWNEWTQAQRAHLRPALEEAREKCTRWAQEAGFEPPAMPF
ncbi:MAG: NUDIX hydrolase [Deltaproteobacteria bacterium]|nr:NUDIX hydrolase [Deltaproteobacteria bacterium]